MKDKRTGLVGLGLLLASCLLGGWTADPRGATDEVRAVAKAMNLKYLAKHDTVAYLYYKLLPDSCLPSELPLTGTSGMIYADKICLYGKVIRVDSFLENGRLYTVEAQEFFWGDSSSDTVKFFRHHVSADYTGAPFEGDSVFISGTHFPYWFAVTYKEARDSLLAGKIVYPAPGVYPVGEIYIVHGDTTNAGVPVDTMRNWLEEAAVAKRNFLGGK